MAIVFHPDGTMTPFDPANGTHFELEQLQRVVGGFIEEIHFDGSLVLIFNEHGGPSFDNLPHNAAASKWAASHGKPVQLYGPVALCHVRGSEVVP